MAATTNKIIKLRAKACSLLKLGCFAEAAIFLNKARELEMRNEITAKRYGSYEFEPFVSSVDRHI